jgi:hypothetical protein
MKRILYLLIRGGKNKKYYEAKIRYLTKLQKNESQKEKMQLNHDAYFMTF